MIITLLTDLGTEDAAVANAKAMFLRTVPDAEVVDLTHQVSRHNWREAAYLLATSFGSFPVGTVHIAPVAVFAERQPRMILAEKEGHYFLAPDNGLLAVALGNKALSGARLCRQYSKPYSFAAWIDDTAHIAESLFRIKDIKHPSIEADLQKADDTWSFVDPPQLPPPLVTPINVACRVLYADRYNNMVLNIKKEEFDTILSSRRFKIKTFKGQSITSVSRQYNDVAAGEPLCRFNSAGYMEVAVNHGSAMELFGLAPGDTSALDYHTVRIYFS